MLGKYLGFVLVNVEGCVLLWGLVYFIRDIEVVFKISLRI